MKKKIYLITSGETQSIVDGVHTHAAQKDLVSRFKDRIPNRTPCVVSGTGKRHKELAEFFALNVERQNAFFGDADNWTGEKVITSHGCFDLDAYNMHKPFPENDVVSFIVTLPEGTLILSDILFLHRIRALNPIMAHLFTIGIKDGDIDYITHW